MPANAKRVMPSSGRFVLFYKEENPNRDHLSDGGDGDADGDGTAERCRLAEPARGGYRAASPAPAEAHRLLASWQQKAAALQAEVTRREKAEAELRAVLQQREELLQSLAEASSAKDELLAMLGHELRNPLSPIVTALQLMRMRGDTGTSREQAVIQRQVDHLVRLVDDLLDISRVARGKIELKRSRVELRDVVQRAVQRCSPLFEQRGHRLTVEVDAALACDGDADRLVQILGHLLNNAARYTPAGGEIRLQLRRQTDARVQIEVSDNGNGIAPEMLPRLFDRFVPGRRSVQRSEGGLGLGLALVKSLAELHGGQVSAHSAGPGQGSCFRVQLPLLPSPQEAASALPAQTPSQGALQGASQAALPQAHGMPATASATACETPSRATGQRILLVDDNIDAAETLAQFLRANGHEVRLAHDPVCALRLLEDFRPEVALLDIGLPVMDGYELGGRILQRVAGCRLIAVSGYGQAHDRQRSAQAGFEAHLAKPVAPGQLAEVVRGPNGLSARQAGA